MYIITYEEIEDIYDTSWDFQMLRAMPNSRNLPKYFDLLPISQLYLDAYGLFLNQLFGEMH